MQSSSTERASTGVGRGTGPPRDAGALLDGGGQMETGGCAEAGGETSTGGWQGSRDAVAMSCCRICSSAAACARLRVGSSHSPALKWFAEAQPLYEILWLPSQPLSASGSWLEPGSPGGWRHPARCCSLPSQAERLWEQRNTMSRGGGLGPLVFLLTPDQLCARLRVAFAFPYADGGG